MPLVTEPLNELERRIDALRAAIRRAAMEGDKLRATELRRDLRLAEREWDQALARVTPSAARVDPPRESGAADRPASSRAVPHGEGSLPAGAHRAGSRQAGPLLPLREQVHQALTLLTVAAAPRMVVAVHQAFFAGGIHRARLTSLRRDEERSFRTAPFARPYYICSALTADLLAPARGLLAVSTWPMERRVIGPLSPRVDFLTAAIQVAESILRLPSPGPSALRLLWRFAANIPGASEAAGAMDPATVAQAAQAEREIHAERDFAVRQKAAQRARRQLGDAEQLFGTRLRALPHAGTGT